MVTRGTSWSTTFRLEMQMKVKKAVEKHKTQSIHYLENALKWMNVGNAEKASEFLWGSMAQALKALAARKGISLRSHRLIHDYAYLVSKELNDESLRVAFDKAQSLHSNFYECGLSIEDVAVGAEEVRPAVAKLLQLTEKDEQRG